MPHVTVEFIFSPVSRCVTGSTNHKAIGETGREQRESGLNRKSCFHKYHCSGVQKCGPGKSAFRKQKSQLAVQFIKFLKCPLNEQRPLVAILLHLHHKGLETIRGDLQLHQPRLLLIADIPLLQMLLKRQSSFREGGGDGGGQGEGRGGGAAAAAAVVVGLSYRH